MIRQAAAALVLASAGPATAAAEAGIDLSARAGLWSHARTFDSPQPVPIGALHLRGAAVVAPGVDASGEAWMAADLAGGVSGDLREARVRLETGPLTLTAGRQIIVWGRADRLNPTDVVGSRDYTLLRPVDDEQRRGVGMVGADLLVGETSVSVLWLPEFRPNILPLDEGRPGILVLPDQRRTRADQVAVRIDRTGGGVDWSLSLFDGIDRTRDIVRVPLPDARPPGTVLAIQQQFPDVRTFGADIAGVIGRIGWRAELAFSDMRGGTGPFGRQDHLWAVGGFDTSLAGGWNVNVQASYRHVPGFRDPAAIADPRDRAVALRNASVSNQLHAQQLGYSARLAKSFRQDRLRFELAIAGHMRPSDVAIRPLLTYAATDTVRLSIGADLFAGPELSYFGSVRRLSGAFVEIRHGF
jgi:hypothetical protein